MKHMVSTGSPRPKLTLFELCLGHLREPEGIVWLLDAPQQKAHSIEEPGAAGTLWTCR